MNLDHDDFDQRIADLENLDTLDDDIVDHAARCERCRTRLELARRIRATAPQLIQHAEEDHITAAVLARTHHRHPLRPKLLAAAAAVVVASGSAIVLLQATDSQTDVLADIADDYANSDRVRFVYSTDATIDLAEEFDLDQTPPTEIRALGSQIPTCGDADPGKGESTPTGPDLGPIVDAIASDDPCLALELIDESARPAQDAFNTLARSIVDQQTAVDQVLNSQGDTELVSASATAFIEDQRDQLDTARTALSDLDNSFTTLAETVEPLSSTGSDGFTAAAVETDLRALRADTSAALDAASAADPVVAWTQVATGTWTAENITVEGITEGRGTVDTYTTVAEDPLGLAETVLDRPGILLDLLESAPASTDNLIEWTVPNGLLDSDLEWTATARLDEGRLVDLRLESSDATITLTPER